MRRLLWRTEKPRKRRNRLSCQTTAESQSINRSLLHRGEAWHVCVRWRPAEAAQSGSERHASMDSISRFDNHHRCFVMTLLLLLLLLLVLRDVDEILRWLKRTLLHWKVHWLGMLNKWLWILSFVNYFFHCCSCILLHCALASCGGVYCNRSCLWVCDSERAGGRCLLPR